MKITCHFQPDSPATDLWVQELTRLMPGAEVSHWQPGETPADYAVTWNPCKQFITEQSKLKAIFNAGAGVDAFLKLGLTLHCPLIRLEDAGMAEQMSDYVTQSVLYHFRDFDRYKSRQQAAQWRPITQRNKQDFPVGVLGLGVLGKRVAHDLQQRGFPVHAWTRSMRTETENIRLFHGAHELGTFLAASQILVCLLPLTPETENILNLANLRRLRRNAYVINVARGGHIVDEDLIAAIDEGQISGATLDVFREEPLPSTHPFWQHPSICVTPHISAMTLRENSVQQILEKIKLLEAGLPVTGIVNTQRGY